MSNEYLERAPGFGHVVHIPFKRTRFGAIHDVSATGAYGLLGNGLMLDELQQTSLEIKYRHAVSDLVALPTPCLITVPGGIFRLVMVWGCEGRYTFRTEELKPTRGFVVGGGIAFGLQPLVTNAVTCSLLHRRFLTDQSWTVPHDHPDVVSHWERFDDEVLQLNHLDPAALE